MAIPLSPDAMTIKPQEIDALADRMLARSASCMFDVQPELRRDMLVCVGCLRELARLCPMEGMTIRVWRELF